MLIIVDRDKIGKTMSKEKMTAVVMGSFQFKREIDRTIEEFKDLHLEVLAPETGNVIIGRAKQFRKRVQGEFNPLLSERKMPIKVVENRFLRAVAAADLAYIANVDGHVGSTVAMEMGYAWAFDKMLFAKFTFDKSLDKDESWARRVSMIPVVEPAEAVKRTREYNEIMEQYIFKNKSPEFGLKVFRLRSGENFNPYDLNEIGRLLEADVIVREEPDNADSPGLVKKGIFKIG